MLEVRTEKFEGPLDLLLNLIEKEKLDITQISLAKITDSYLKEISEMKRSGEEMAEFLVIAAKLLYIKSKELLPNIKSEEEEQEIVDLETRLKEYQKYKEAAQKLADILSEGKRGFIRKAKNEQIIGFHPPKNIKSNQLFTIFEEIIKKVQETEMPEEKIEPISVTIEQKREHITAHIKKYKNVSFRKILESAKNKVEVIVTFLAILEMIKQKEVKVMQEKNFADFTIEGVK